MVGHSTSAPWPLKAALPNIRLKPPKLANLTTNWKVSFHRKDPVRKQKKRLQLENKRKAAFKRKKNRSL